MWLLRKSPPSRVDQLPKFNPTTCKATFHHFAEQLSTTLVRDTDAGTGLELTTNENPRLWSGWDIPYGCSSLYHIR